MMRWIIIRRILTIRLALLFVIDYWKICIVTRHLKGIEQEKAMNRIYRKAGRRMKSTAFLLKGIIVKIGQFINMRHDILPMAFTKELTDLQDSLPAVPFHKIYRSIERELGQQLDDVFLSFEKNAVAAASLAQVHRAVLKDGNKVAVKILRPGIEQITKADLSTLRIIAWVVQRIPGIRRKMDFVNLHREFSKTIWRELDGIQEMEHMEKFNRMFANQDSIHVPFVYKEFTSKRLLTMEFIEGSKITDEKHLKVRNIDGLKTAEAILECYFRQILVYGFIHLDPHPGNILIKDNGEVYLLDFGMVDQLSKQEVQTLRHLLQSFMIGDVDGIVSCIDNFGYIPDQSHIERVKQMITKFMDSLDSLEFNDETSSIQNVVSNLRSFIQDNPIQLQAKYMFLFRCIGMLMTTITTLAPSIIWMESLFKIGPTVFNTPITIENKID
jgi:predicted unusual protein kinase regulating ubiquinone biosynthesis (AarF/ABC1/UbiB family)